jgi:predicted ferric reductase
MQQFKAYVFKSNKKNTMNSILYIVAVILIIGWVLGAFVYSAGGLIHILLVIAIIAIVLGFIRGRSAV